MGDGFYSARYGQQWVPGAVVPPRPEGPPPPPPPASGATPRVEHRELPPRGMFPQDAWNPRCACGKDWPCPDVAIPPSRDVAKRSTVDVTGATEALVVGPNDVLIVSFPEHMTMQELYAMRDRMRDSDLRDGQILLIAGADKLVKVQQEPTQPTARQYARPTIEGAEFG